MFVSYPDFAKPLGKPRKAGYTYTSKVLIAIFSVLVIINFSNFANAALTSKSYVDTKTAVSGDNMAAAGQIAKYVADGATGEMKLQGLSLSPVATSGSYSDLTGNPGILTTADILTGTDTTNKLASAETLNAAIGGYATTAGTTTAYTATIPGFVLENGAMVRLKMHTYNNSNPTLNINNTGAKAIKAVGGQSPSTSLLGTGAVVDFIYDSADGVWYIISGRGAMPSDSVRIGNLTYNTASFSPSIKYGMMSYAGVIITTGGTASAYTITDSTNYTTSASYFNTGTKVVARVHVANTAGATLNLNGMGAKAIYFNDAPITEGLLQGDGTYTLVYDGTNWNILMSPNAGTIPLPTAECLDSDKSCVLRFGTFTPLLYLLPAGYTALEYIQSSGTQYIDTGIVVNTFDYDIETDASFDTINTNGPNTIWGFIHNPSYPRWGVSGYISRYLMSPSATSPFGTQDTNRHTFLSQVFDDNGTKKYSSIIDGVVQENSITMNTSGWTTNTLPIFLFARNSGGTTAYNWVSAKVYDFKIMKAGGVIQNLIPARRNSDSVLGMYDTVSGQFLINAGTGTFTAGPDLPGQSGDTTIGHYWEVVER